MEESHNNNDDNSDDGASSDFYGESPPVHRDAPFDGASDTDELSAQARPPNAQDIPIDYLAQRICRLPPELWQCVFSFCTLSDLIRIRQVNRLFNMLLDEHRSCADIRTITGRETLKHPANVWMLARYLQHPQLPRPLTGCSESQMWRLLTTNRCEICKGSRQDSNGLRDDSPIVLWSFAVCLCIACLKEQVESLSSFHLSSTPIDSLIAPLLPFAFVSQLDEVVPTSSLDGYMRRNPHEEVVKVIYKPYVERLRRELTTARRLGKQHEIEIFNKLKALKDHRMQDALSYERWEQDFKLEDVTIHHEARGISLPLQYQTSGVKVASEGSDDVTQLVEQSLASSSNTPRHSHRQLSSDFSRNKQALRRAQIEEECCNLNPPLSPELLEHMGTFKAAVQIARPLTAREWNFLKPRLLAEKPDVEQKMQDQSVREESGRLSRSNNHSHPEVMSKEAREAQENEWDESQAHVRNQLGHYADELIQNYWANGMNVNYEKSPEFAAEVLTHVRKRFYSDLKLEDKSPPEDHSQISPVKSLVLDNMKWIYDTKVKPIAEKYRKDLFLCSACGNQSKYFAFEGVIQHYAAKHTNLFGTGPKTVQWKTAEWPESPPFSQNPRIPNFQNSAGSQGPGSSQGPVFVPTHGHSASIGFPAGSPRPYGNPLLISPYPGYAQGGGPFPPPHYTGNFVGRPNPFHPHGQFQNSTSPVHSIGNVSVPPHGTVYLPPNPSSSTPMGTQPVSKFYQTQLDYVARDAVEIWSSISGIKPTYQGVKIYIVISRVVSDFRMRFSNELTLDLFSASLLQFSESLINKELMKTLKEATGLACKKCVLDNEALESHSVPSRFNQGERKLHPFYSLLLHFKNVHVGNLVNSQDDNPDSSSPLRPDWKEDMIELPEANQIVELARNPAVDGKTLRLLEQSFPRIFGAIKQTHRSQTILEETERGRHSPYAGIPTRQPSLNSTHQTQAKPSDGGDVANDKSRETSYARRGHNTTRNFSPSNYAESTGVQTLGKGIKQFQITEYDHNRPVFVDSGGHSGREASYDYTNRSLLSQEPIADDPPRMRQSFQGSTGADPGHSTKLNRGPTKVSSSVTEMEHDNVLEVAQQRQRRSNMYIKEPNHHQASSEIIEIQDRDTTHDESGKAAADKFLENFRPAQDVDEYMWERDEQHRRRDIRMNAQWPSEGLVSSYDAKANAEHGGHQDLDSHMIEDSTHQEPAFYTLGQYEWQEVYPSQPARQQRGNQGFFVESGEGQFLKSTHSRSSPRRYTAHPPTRELVQSYTTSSGGTPENAYKRRRTPPTYADEREEYQEEEVHRKRKRISRQNDVDLDDVNDTIYGSDDVEFTSNTQPPSTRASSSTRP